VEAMERASVINQFREELEIKDEADDEQEGDHHDEENPDLAPKRHGASLYSCCEWTSALRKQKCWRLTITAEFGPRDLPSRHGEHRNRSAMPETGSAHHMNEPLAFRVRRRSFTH
jgi:hypothetical protein